MTTDISSADPDPRLLRAHDPAELIAEARICLGLIPRDSLVLFGHDGRRTSPLVTRSDRRHLLAPEGREHLENHLELMRRRGCRGAFALLLIGDGYESVPEELMIETAGRAGAMLLTTARFGLVEPFVIERLWVVGAGTGRELVLGQGSTQEEIRLWVSPPRPLREFSETHAATHAVLTGHQTPRDLPLGGVLAAAGADLRLRGVDPDRTDARDLFDAARAAVSRLGAGAAHDHDRYVTDCEHLALLLSAVAVDSLHWELLAQCIDRGQDRPVDRDRLLQELTKDGRWRPHADVCAGGSWYSTLETLRVVARVRAEATSGEQEVLAEAAWRGLTVLQALLSWWNHRFATAGDLVDELWTRDPGSTLAPLLSRLTDEPIAPAWWPHD